MVAFQPQLLQNLWKFVGVERGADFLVYIAILGLGVTVFSLIQYLLHQQQELTRLTSALAQISPSPQALISPTSSKDNYLFLIRAYNEAQVLGEVIDEIIHHGFSNIAICNDWSSDQTKQVIEQKISSYPHIRIFLLNHMINRWPGAANKTLFSFAKNSLQSLDCQWAVSYDADGQMDIKDMNTFMHAAQTQKFDIIIGSRFIAWWSSSNIPFARKVVLRWGRIITYIFNGLRLSDVSSGYRLYNKYALDHISIYSDRFSYQNDIVESIRRHRLRLAEVPIHIRYTDYSLAKGQSNLSAFKILVRLIYSSLFHR